VGWRLLPVLGAALAVSLAIEVTQYATDLGRTADVNDLLTNVLGAAIGWALARALARARILRDSLGA
jgi:glycopeptide antibiotics resistance protein